MSLAGAVVGAPPGERIGLELVPPDATFVLSVRLSELAWRDEQSGLVPMLDEVLPVLEGSKLCVADIREVMFINYGGLGREVKTRRVVRFVDHAREKQFMEVVKHRSDMKQLDDSATWQNARQRITEIDPTTIVNDPIVDKVNNFPQLKNAMPRWAEAWGERKDGVIVFAVANTGSFIAWLITRFERFDDNLIEMFYPLYSIDWAVGGVRTGDPLTASGVVRCRDEATPESIRDTLQAASLVWQNVMQFKTLKRTHMPDRTIEEPKDWELKTTLCDLMSKTFASAEWKIHGSRIRVSMKLPVATKEFGELATRMAPLVQKAREEALFAQSIENIKELDLSLLNYESVHRAFPAAVSYAMRGGKRSKYPHSCESMCCRISKRSNLPTSITSTSR